jgi:hypothetical protein
LKIRNYKKLDRKEFQSFPKEIENLLNGINDKFSELTNATQGNLTTRENLAAEPVDITVRDGVETQVELQKLKSPTIGLIVWSDNYPDRPPKLSWANAGEKRVKLTCFFDTPPGRAVNVRLEFRV